MLVFRKEGKDIWKPATMNFTETSCSQMKTDVITTSVQEQLVTAFQISALLTSDLQSVWTEGGQRTGG